MDFTCTQPTTFPFLDLPFLIQFEVLAKLPVSDVTRCRCTSKYLNRSIENNRMSLARRKVKSVSIAPPWASSGVKPNLRFSMWPILQADIKSHFRETIPLGHRRVTHWPSFDIGMTQEVRNIRTMRQLSHSLCKTCPMELSEAFVVSFEQLVVSNRIRIAQFNFGICNFCCDWSSFCRLMEVVQLRELCIMSSTVAEDNFCPRILTSSAANKLDRLAVGFPSRIPDDYLLSSKHSWLAIRETTITWSAVRAFILDWMNGRRLFDYMGLSTSCRLEAERILEDIPKVCQVDEFTVMLSSKLGEKMMLTIEENSFVMFNKTAERIMCELDCAGSNQRTQGDIDS